MMSKERRVKTLNEVFTIRGGNAFSNQEIFGIFMNTADDFTPNISHSSLEMFFKVGALFDDLSFNLSVYGNPKQKGSVIEINVPEFSQRVLNEVMNYRIINKRGAEGNYKLIQKDKPIQNNSTYVIAQDNEAIFKIKIKDPSPWFAGPMTFSDCSGDIYSEYNPDFTSRQVDLKTVLPHTPKNDHEKIMKTYFTKFHNTVKKAHQERDAMTSNPKS